jgi:hypothetical protein
MINCLKSLLFWPKSSSSSEEPFQSIIQRVKGLWARISSYLWSTPTEDLVFDNIYSGENKDLQKWDSPIYSANKDLQKWDSPIYLANKNLQYVFLSAFIPYVNSENNKKVSR